MKRGARSPNSSSSSEALSLQTDDLVRKSSEPELDRNGHVGAMTPDKPQRKPLNIDAAVVEVPKASIAPINAPKESCIAQSPNEPTAVTPMRKTSSIYRTLTTKLSFCTRSQMNAIVGAP